MSMIMKADKTNHVHLLGPVLALTVALSAPSNAQTVVTSNNEGGSTLELQAQGLENRVGSSRAQLKSILQERGLADVQIAKLTEEIDQIRKDRASITTALVAAAKTEQKLSRDILDLQEQLEDLGIRAAALTTSLWERRALLTEVLAALQRMGLNPPPAILVQPEDALASVRSSILLASVVPKMREQTSILIEDLRELATLQATTEQESERLTLTRTEQASEQGRLELLILEKRELEEQARSNLRERELRARQLADEAQSLEKLIGELQAEAATIREEAARRAAEERQRLEQEEAERLAALQAAEEARLAALAREEAEQQAALEEAEKARLEAQAALERARERAEQLAQEPQIIAPAVRFSNLRNSLPQPVAGRTITAFGANDGLGDTAQGDTIETLPNTIVTAPADGTVLYAGPFRAYGNVLILDAGEKYHIVLAGMDRIDVSEGQFVIAGEPVGIMGSVRLASVSAAAATGDKPTLYVELRQNGRPIDIGQWWSS
ncbi:MAG: peptidoglycan DD-metalloendopeptidase family protein [Pseudomonadota bacterium]